MIEINECIFRPKAAAEIIPGYDCTGLFQQPSKLAAAEPSASA
jgi:hypothetical protein